ncbi:MAG: zinc ribbon domain-containing protein [Phycisphaerae bacterium]
MPTYEYACQACGHKFEEFQSIKAPPTKKCPSCRKNKVQRLISSGAGFIFKGSGFYQTDYRSEAYKTSAKNDSANAASPGTTPSTTPAAATPAAKTESTSPASTPSTSKTEKASPKTAAA